MTMKKGLLFLLVFGGCVPDLGLPGSLVTETRVLAVSAEPPEADPRGDPGVDTSRRLVRFDALTVSPNGTVAGAQLGWSFCLAPKPLTENNAASIDCLGSDAKTLQQIGDPLAAVVPDSACQNFGPETPQQQPGESPKRPRDPDITGGYYQPVQLAMPLSQSEAMTRGESRDVTIELLRISCNLAGASPDIIRKYNQLAMGRQNRNPLLDAPRVFDAQGVEPIFLDENGKLQAQAGAVYTLQASWPAESAEQFPAFDLLTADVALRNESLRVSWFTTAGSFAAERTGRDSDEAQRLTSSDNTWTAPDMPGPATIWIVLRDNRGGTAWRELPVEVR